MAIYIQWKTVAMIAAASFQVSYASDTKHVEKRAPACPCSPEVNSISWGLVCDQGEWSSNIVKGGFSDCEGMIETGCENMANCVIAKLEDAEHAAYRNESEESDDFDSFEWSTGSPENEDNEDNMLLKRAKSKTNSICKDFLKGSPEREKCKEEEKAINDDKKQVCQADSFNITTAQLEALIQRCAEYKITHGCVRDILHENCGVAGNKCESFESCVLGACDSSHSRYTSDMSDWSVMNSLALAVPSVNDHTPDGVTWATYTEWDQIPRSFESFSSNKAFSEWMCPYGIPRGIREVYYLDPIFANPEDPTKAEVDHWHRRTIRHFRRLVGISEQDVPIKMDKCLAVNALWGNEYRLTQKHGDNSAECEVKPHCGYKFSIADKINQRPYFSKRYFKNNGICHSMNEGGAEGIGSTNADVPWALKVSRTFCGYLDEGVVGHAGPVFTRPIVGIDVMFNETHGDGNTATVRAQWIGARVEWFEAEA